MIPGTSHLEELVLRKISELGELPASEFFEVSPSLVRQWAAGSKRPSLAAVERVFSPEAYEREFRGRIQEADWEGKKVCLLLPQYKLTNPRTMLAMMRLLDREKMNVMMRFGDAFIVHTRNALAEAFLKTGIEESYWGDDDMIPPVGDAAWYNTATGFNLPAKFAGLHSINRLRSHGKSIVGGLYFGRNDTRRPMYALNPLDQAELAFAHSAPHDVIRPVNWVATGALLVRRQVYLDIQAKFPELAPQGAKEAWHFFSNSETDLTRATEEALKVLDDDAATEGARIAKVRALLTFAQDSARRNSQLQQGEDVTFCKRARDAGHQPYVDFGLVCGHVGEFCFGPLRK